MAVAMDSINSLQSLPFSELFFDVCNRDKLFFILCLASPFLTCVQHLVRIYNLVDKANLILFERIIIRIKMIR